MNTKETQTNDLTVAAPTAQSAPAPPAASPPSTAPVIGKTSATERDANSSDKFNFWLAPGQIVNPFDIVEVEHLGQALDADGRPTNRPSRSYGLVTTIEHRTDSPNHLANYVSSNFGDVSETEVNTPRIGTNVAKVNVLSNSGEVYMPVQNDRPVRFASADGIAEALGIDAMSPRNRIPAGLIKMSNGASTVAFLDQEFILGPEGAHINISGISGLATKTSYAMFMLQAILQRAERATDDEGTPLRDKIAVIILNVKQGDLLQIDQPGPPPSVDQMELWEALELEPRPFRNVRYLLPRSNDPGRPNSFLVPVSGFQMYAYALPDAADKLDLLLSDVMDQSGAMDALVGDIMQGLANNEPAFRNTRSWDNLLNGEPLVKNGQTQKWGDHYPSTIGKFRRHLRRIVRTRSTGLFTNARARNELNLAEQIREIEGGNTYVVDIARLSDEEQKLVFGDVLRTVYELKAEDPENRRSTKPIPEKIIFFVDELNKYAPSGREGSPILQQVLDIAERGRSLGVVLFSAQQFLSAVHPRVTGNCATKILGRTGSSEIATPDYRFLDDDLKMNLTRLGKGELIVTHAVYRQPVKIIFPRPAYQQRQPGT
ncbi:MAG: ATP-binding protein [Verrucomicrobiales bacterium]|nr:ATP-binding protein [Verrucomicrobiales bacterium]